MVNKVAHARLKSPCPALKSEAPCNTSLRPEITFSGARLNDAQEIFFYSPGFAVTKIEPVDATIAFAGTSDADASTVGITGFGWQAALTVFAFLMLILVLVFRPSGLLGEQYIGLDVGGDERMLKAGDTIAKTQSAVVLEKLISQFLFNKASEGPEKK